MREYFWMFICLLATFSICQVGTYNLSAKRKFTVLFSQKYLCVAMEFRRFFSLA